MTERKGVVCCLAVALGCVAAGPCSSSGEGPGTDADVEAGSVSCMTDPTADPALLPGKPAALPLVKRGKSGLLSFVLVQTSPDPPAEDTNIWTIKVLDGSGAARKDATVSFPPSIVGIQPWMPKMKHGSLPAKATNNGDGTYTISNMNLFMTGIWQLTVQAQVSDALPIGDAGDTGADAGDTDAQAAGSMIDQATFTWCVP